MNALLKRGTALFVSTAMMISMIGTVPAAAASSKSQIQTMEETTSYAYHTLNADGTDSGEALVSPSYNTAASGDASVEVFKTISHTNTVNEFDIELKVVTTDKIDELEISADAAVVLVFDTSISMSYGVNSSVAATGKEDSRMDLAQDAAKSFLENFAENAGDAMRMVSIVNFAQYVYSTQSWIDISSDSKLDTAKDFIDELTISTLGGTNIDAGLTKATALVKELQSNKAYSDVESIYVVLLGDGAPTYYVNDSTGANTSSSNSNIGSSTTASQTEAAATSVKATGAQLYTIAFAEGNNPAHYNSGTSGTTTSINDWLSSEIASDEDMHYDAAGGEELVIGFEKIIERIMQLASAWQVTDPMGQFMVLDQESIDGNSYLVNTAGNTIVWNLRDDSPSKSTVNGATTYTYTLDYTVTLNTDAMGFEEDTYYLTNGYTELSYFFINQVTDANGDLVLDNETPVQTIDFKVPAVKGDYPAYTYDVYHWVQTGVDENGKFTYEIKASDEGKTAQKYDMITASARNYTAYNYTLNVGASHSDPVALTVNGQDLNFYYDKDTTSVTVTHEYYTVTTDNSGSNESLDYSTDASQAVVYVGEKYTAPTAAGNGYTLDDVTPSATITLSENAEENVIAFRYVKTEDNRSDVSVIVNHSYTNYTWELVNGTFQEVAQAPMVETDGTVTQKYGTSFTATEKEKAGYEFVSASPSLTIDSLTKDVTTITLNYEQHIENPNPTTEVTVNHVYLVDSTYIDDAGNEVTTRSTAGTDQETIDGLYVSESYTAIPASVYGDNDYTQITDKDDLTIDSLVAVTEDENNVITIKYLREENLLEETDVTVIHNYTLYREAIDDDGKVYMEETYYTEEVTFKDETFYVGQFFTATTANKYNGKTYSVDFVEASTTLDGMTIELESGKNTVTIHYELREDLGDATVTVTHTYYDYIRTYVNGALRIIPNGTQSGETITYVGANGERYTAEEVLDFNDETYTRIDTNALTVTLSESYANTIDLSYSRTVDVFEDTGVTVNHIFTTYTSMIDETGAIVTDVSTETVEGSLITTTDNGSPLYAGMSFTAVEDATLDGREGFTALFDNHTYLVLAVDSDENVINLYYTKSENAKVDASVQVIHHYTTHTITLENGAPVTTSTTSDEKETRIYGMYEGQFFTATENPYNFERTTEDEALSIQLTAGTNTIHINYVITDDYTLPATLDVTHIYTTSFTNGDEDQVVTIQDHTVSSWATVKHTFNVDTNEDLYEIDGMVSENGSMDDDAYTITLVEGENTITIYYERTVENRTPISVTVNHYYTTYDVYTETYNTDGALVETYQVFLEDETYTAKTEEAYNDLAYNWTDGALTIDLIADGTNIVNLGYLRTIDTEPEVEEEEEDGEPSGGGGSSVSYYTLRVNWEDEDGNALDDQEVTSDLRSGTSYSTEEKSFSGYTFVGLASGSHAASGTMNGNRTVTYVYAADVITEIPEEDVPLAETPETDPADPTETPETSVEIPETDVPLSETPEATMEIPETDVPLSDIPQTGDDRNLALVLSIAVGSGLGLAWLLKAEWDEKKKAR